MANGWNVKTDPITGVLKFVLTDSDGDSVASFRLNPTDVRLASRLEEVAKWFSELSENAPERATVADIQKYNDDLENKLAYVLGGNAKETLFSVLPAVSIMPDGTLFAVEVFAKLYEAVVPEINKRRNNLQAAVAKHTAKYQ